MKQQQSGCCLSGKEMLQKTGHFFLAKAVKLVQHDEYIASSSARVEFSVD